MQQINGFTIQIIALILLMLVGCQGKKNEKNQLELEKGTFGYDVDFLKKYRETVILEQGASMLAICPEYQGRVMTSSSAGLEGLSYGWLNYDLIKSGEILEHINPVGGEDRFWLGPEGGQMSRPHHLPGCRDPPMHRPPQTAQSSPENPRPTDRGLVGTQSPQCASTAASPPANVPPATQQG